MGEETSDAMNLDLNLSPGPEPTLGSISSITMSLDERVDDPIHRFREAVRIGARWRRFPIPAEAQNISMELNHLMVNSSNATTLQAGEGSVDAVERTSELPKTCENNNGILEEEASENKDEIEKGNASDGSFFDCNICLDLARNPVVTCCGHLFCWPCLYRWIHLHSDAKECPVCKGEVTLKNVTPIYGRGNHKREPDEDSSVKIPLRPHARRVESLRQTIQRSAFSFPVEEMIRRLGSRFDLTRDFNQLQEPENVRESAERSNLLNRFLTTRGLRREQTPMDPPDDIMDLNQTSIVGPEVGENRRLQSLFLRRTQSQRAAISSLSSALLFEAFRSHPTSRNQEQQPAPPVDDRDSFSSIAAVINSESQIDTAAEIESAVSLSTSSSRRRNEAPRVSDLDTGDSRAPRRRRLN
ncbi:Cdk-activating kinase assembly factor [Parasponia andersonii]|uniref:E3 ubiquitin-protein ligase RMA n=1 Tax=Parasponia andersonii TaxID=3476 RepID=A0A2P5B6V6_PARAD|nr:Cdk-activating kinase assembly factor [Parasponia andersonii]